MELLNQHLRKADLWTYFITAYAKRTSFGISEEFHLNPFFSWSLILLSYVVEKLSFFFFNHNLIAKIFQINWTKSPIL